MLRKQCFPSRSGLKGLRNKTSAVTLRELTKHQGHCEMAGSHQQEPGKTQYLFVNTVLALFFFGKWAPEHEHVQMGNTLDHRDKSCFIIL